MWTAFLPFSGDWNKTRYGWWASASATSTMSTTVGRLLALIGIIFLVHSAHSTHERTWKLSLIWLAHKDVLPFIVLTHLVLTDLSYLNAVDKAESGLPIEVQTGWSAVARYWLRRSIDQLCEISDRSRVPDFRRRVTGWCRPLRWRSQEYPDGKWDEETVCSGPIMLLVCWSPFWWSCFCRTIDKLDTAPSFITFNHRGRRAVSAHSLLQRRSHMS